MKEFISSFDRFAASLAVGFMLLLGCYLLVSAEVKSTYSSLNSFLDGSATKVIFFLPLTVFSYLIGLISWVISNLAFGKFVSTSQNEYVLLDAIEGRNHPTLTKEFSDLINAKQFVMASTFPLFLISVGILRLCNRINGYYYCNVIGGSVLLLISISLPFCARLLYRSMVEIHQCLMGESKSL